MMNERGNVMFYILIAVALLASLIYAVSQSGRGSASQISEEKAKLIASEILEYASSISNAVAQVRLRGTRDEDLCFDDAGWGVANYDHAGCTQDINKIFHLSGGGITWSKAPELAMDKGATPDYLWAIYGSNEITNVGSTCGTADCTDLILVVDELSATVCKKINELLRVTADGEDPPEDTAISRTRYTGTYTRSAEVGDEDSVMTGKSALCFKETTAPEKYVFYKVLIAR